MAEQFALWLLDEQVSGSIPSRTKLGNELFSIVPGLGVLCSAPE